MIEVLLDNADPSQLWSAELDLTKPGDRLIAYPPQCSDPSIQLSLVEGGYGTANVRIAPSNDGIDFPAFTSDVLLDADGITDLTDFRQRCLRAIVATSDPAAGKVRVTIYAPPRKD